MPRRPNTSPTNIYWLVDVRPDTLAFHPDGKPFYCGKTIKSPTVRLQGHRTDARRDSVRPIAKRLHECCEHVRIDLIETVPAGENWVERERFWIATLRHFHPDCVNVQRGGEGTPGLIHSDESRAKMSASRTGKKRGPMSAEHRANLSAAKMGIKLPPCTDETRAKLSAAIKGRTFSDEWRAKLSAAARGRTSSDETRAKVSAAGIGRKQSPETIAKREATMAVIRATPEYRAKLSVSTLGKPKSVTHRQNLSIAKTGKKIVRSSAEATNVPAS